MRLRFLADILTLIFVWNLFNPIITVPVAILSFGKIVFVPQFLLIYFSLLCLVLMLDFTFFTMKKAVTSIVLLVLGTAAFQNWAIGLLICVLYFILAMLFSGKKHY